MPSTPHSNSAHQARSLVAMHTEPAYKIPFLIAGVIGNSLALTSPNSSPLPEERAKYGKGVFETSPFTAVRAITLLKYLSNLLFTLETLTILAASHPFFHDFAHRIPLLQTQGDTVDDINITTSFVVGFTMMALGTVIRVVAYRQLGPNFTFELAVRKEHKLITSGLYSVVRHPSYLGASLYFSGVGICQTGLGSYWQVSGWGESYAGNAFGLVYWLCIVQLYAVMAVRMGKEDVVLREAFPEQWDAWASKTRYRLIPLVY